MGLCSLSQSIPFLRPIAATSRGRELEIWPTNDSLCSLISRVFVLTREALIGGESRGHPESVPLLGREAVVSLP